MKIHDGNLTNLGGAGGAGRSNAPNSADAVGRRSSKGGVGRSEQSADGDSIQLSNLSQELGVEQTETPEREQRIDQLRSEVRAGTYQPEALDVSRALITDAIDLNVFRGPSE